MSSVEDSVNRIIDKTRLRTFPKIRAAVRKDHPDITDKELRETISRRNHDVGILFININTRYVVAYELPDKTKNSIHHVLVMLLMNITLKSLLMTKKKAWSPI